MKTRGRRRTRHLGPRRVFGDRMARVSLYRFPSPPASARREWPWIVMFGHAVFDDADWFVAFFRESVGSFVAFFCASVGSFVTFLPT